VLQPYFFGLMNCNPLMLLKSWLSGPKAAGQFIDRLNFVAN